jgi:hypothetical protein
MNPWMMPLADAGDWNSIALLVLVVFFFVVAPLLSKIAEAQARAARRARPGPPRPAGPTPKDPLADEIAEFLKRASQPQGPAAPARPAAGPPPVVSPLPDALQPFRPPQPRPSPPPLEAEIVGEAPKRESVADHVRESFGQRTFGQVGSQDLGKEVAAADNKVESRLRGVFDHQLGQLAGVAGEASQATAAVQPTAPADRIEAAPATSAAALAAMLTNPLTLRQAVLIGEILHRPEERWK